MPFDFAAVAVPFRMQPGLRRLAPGAAQLTPNRPGDPALAAKLQVLQQHADEALLQVHGFDAAPMLARLEAHAAQEHPQALVCSTHELAAPLLGWSLHGESVQGDGDPAVGAVLRSLAPPWRRPGLLALAFAEDFAILDGTDATIPWLAVCLPSHWSPRQKVGRHFAEVHAPVADNRVLLAASDHLARLVTGAQRWERFVWTISPDGALDHHPARTALPPWPAQADAAALAARAWFRTERQTFIPAPELEQAVFTIHVEARPLAEAITTPERAASLHDAIASMSTAVLAYRGLTDARDRLLAWLAARR